MSPVDTARHANPEVQYRPACTGVDYHPRDPVLEYGSTKQCGFTRSVCPSMVCVDGPIRCPDAHLIASAAVGKVLEASGEVELQLAAVGGIGNGKLYQDFATDSTRCIMIDAEMGCVVCKLLGEGGANGD